MRTVTVNVVVGLLCLVLMAPPAFAADSCGGGCPNCRDEQEQPVIQRRLAIGPVDDPYERQADAVASVCSCWSRPWTRRRAVGPCSRRTDHAFNDGRAGRYVRSVFII